MRGIAERARRRRRRRGAAMVEATVAIPFFVTIFGGIVFVGQMYQTKIGVMRLTKQSAWSYAMANCGEAGNGTTTHVATSSDAPGAGTANVGGGLPDGVDLGTATQIGGGAPNAGIATKSYGSADASMRRTVGADAYIGGYAKSMASHTRVMCNEPPYDGDLAGTLKAAVSAFNPFNY